LKLEDSKLPKTIMAYFAKIIISPKKTFPNTEFRSIFIRGFKTYLNYGIVNNPKN